MGIQKNDPRKADKTDVEVGRLVRVLRISRGLSQAELADRMGVTLWQVHKYEIGKNRISMGRLTRVAKLFGVSVPYLLEGGKQPAVLKSGARANPDYSHAFGMLGRIGVQRLLTAFAAVPAKPAGLRESIVRIVETVAAAAARGKGLHKRTKRR